MTARLALGEKEERKKETIMRGRKLDCYSLGLKLLLRVVQFGFIWEIYCWL